MVESLKLLGWLRGPVNRQGTEDYGFGRAFRCKRMLANGEYATIAELSERKGIAPPYMNCFLRLSCLPPTLS